MFRNRAVSLALVGLLNAVALMGCSSDEPTEPPWVANRQPTLLHVRGSIVSREDGTPVRICARFWDINNKSMEPCGLPDLWVCSDETGMFEFEIEVECAPGDLAGHLVIPGNTVTQFPMCTTEVQHIDLLYHRPATSGDWG